MNDHARLRLLIHNAYNPDYPGSNITIRFGKKGKKDNSNGIIRNIEKAKMMAIVDAMPSPYREWLIFTYAPEHQKRTYDVIFTHLWSEFRRRETNKLHEKTLEKLTDLCAYIIYDERHRNISGQRLYSINDFCRAMEYKDQKAANWKKTYNRHYQTLCTILYFYDREALETVGNTLLEKQKRIRRG